MIAITEMDKW